ncbi:MAG: hypothetical protein P1U41_00660 [Vicingaceae bacterium]|nr:hypothetical protein [Vicingaceae bacterium]
MPDNTDQKNIGAPKQIRISIQPFFIFKRVVILNKKILETTKRKILKTTIPLKPSWAKGDDKKVKSGFPQ